MALTHIHTRVLALTPRRPARSNTLILQKVYRLCNTYGVLLCRENEKYRGATKNASLMATLILIRGTQYPLPHHTPPEHLLEFIIPSAWTTIQ